MNHYIVPTLRALRPHHWIKNFLVFVPLIFSGNIQSIELLSRSIILFINFCFLASSVYILNDLVDRDVDRKHPFKKNRPFASGQLPPSYGVFLLIVLLTISLIGSYFLSLITFAIFVSYFILNLFYSFMFKNIPPIDILIIAIFYVIRAIVGAEVIHVLPSQWLVATTTFAALFFVCLKRSAELKSINSGQEKSRKNIDIYHQQSIGDLITFSLTATIVSYTIYATTFTYIFIFSVIPIIGLLTRLMLLKEMRPKLFETPEKVIFHDKATFSFAILWIIIVILYHWT